MCPQLETVQLYLSQKWANSYYPEGWMQLTQAMPYLPRSVRLLTLDLDCDFAEEVELFRSVSELRDTFEGLIVERRPSTILSIRPNDRPVLDVHEQTQVRALFPRLAESDLLEF